MKKDVIIIGGGAAGLTAAIYASRANLNPVVLAGPLPGGLLTQTTDVENFPGFPDAVNGYELMFKFQQQAEKFGAKIVNETVQSVKLVEGGPHELVLGNGEIAECRALIIATGTAPRWLGLPSEEKFLNKGVSACATCDGAFFRKKTTAVIGGGDVALEDAIFLARLCEKVYVIHRRDEFRGAKSLQKRLMELPNVEILWDTVPEEICGAEKVETLKLLNKKTGEKRELAVDGVFVAVGITPNSEEFKGSVDMDPAGYIVAGEAGKTNVPGIFAAGDVRTKALRQIVTAVVDGANCVASVEQYLYSIE